MPKDEFDFADPFELNGVALPTEEDTTDAMGECFAEEFLRLGYAPQAVLALFRNPHYLGPHRVLQQRGEAFVRALITEACARWGRTVVWLPEGPNLTAAIEPAAAPLEFETSLIDPTGAAVPRLNP